MAVITPVTFDPIAQASYGLAGLSITQPQLSFIVFSTWTFGYLYNKGNFAECSAAPSTTWTDCTAFD